VNARALSKRAFPYLVVAAGGFLIAYLLLFFFAFPADVLPDDGRVPRVVGKSFDEASSLLEQAGFHALKGQIRFHKTTPADIVLEQDPQAGSLQKRGAEVTLAISGGQRTAVVPEVRGVSQQQARIAIETAGFTFGSVSQETSTEPRGAVIASDPVAGTTSQLPATVSITLSQGPASVQIPDLTGRTLADARSTLEQIGLRLGGTTADTSSFMPENMVLGQTPEAGATVSSGANVRLRISRFPAPVAPQPVPPLPRDSLREESR
jgi:serine/threonine-protein kinase